MLSSKSSSKRVEWVSCLRFNFKKWLSANKVLRVIKCWDSTPQLFTLPFPNVSTKKKKKYLIADTPQ